MNGQDLVNKISELLAENRPGCEPNADDHDHKMPRVKKLEDCDYFKELTDEDLLTQIAEIDKLGKKTRALEQEMDLLVAKGRFLIKEVEAIAKSRYAEVLGGDIAGCQGIGIARIDGKFYVVGVLFHSEKAKQRQLQPGQYL